jgi:hypothetical protein
MYYLNPFDQPSIIVPLFKLRGGVVYNDYIAPSNITPGQISGVQVSIVNLLLVNIHDGK